MLIVEVLESIADVDDGLDKMQRRTLDFHDPVDLAIGHVKTKLCGGTSGMRV